MELRWITYKEDNKCPFTVENITVNSISKTQIINEFIILKLNYFIREFWNIDLYHKEIHMSTENQCITNTLKNL